MGMWIRYGNGMQRRYGNGMQRRYEDVDTVWEWDAEKVWEWDAEKVWEWDVEKVWEWGCIFLYCTWYYDVRMHINVCVCSELSTSFLQTDKIKALNDDSNVSNPRENPE